MRAIWSTRGKRWCNRVCDTPLSLPYRAFDKDQRVTHTAIVENKRLGEVLAYIKERQDEMRPLKVKTNSEKSGSVKRGRGLIRNGTARHAAFTAPSPVPPERMQTVVL